MKYLVVKLSSLGDIIQTLPFASYLDGEVSWAVESDYIPLLRSVPTIKHVIPIPFRKWRRGECRFSELSKALRTIGAYDTVFDLQGNCKSALVTKFAKAKKKIGLKNPAEWPNRLVTNQKIALPQNLPIKTQLQTFYRNVFQKEPNEKPLQLLGENLPLPKRTFMVCMGSRWENKELPEALWKSFLHELQKRYQAHLLFVFGEEKQMPFPNSTTLIKPEFGTWQRLMCQVDLILTVDSASLALANTTTTPTFALFGPSSAKIFGPTSSGSGSFQGACPYGETFIKRCKHLRTCETGSCLNDATLRQLLEAFQNQCGSQLDRSLHESSPCPQSESSPCTM